MPATITCTSKCPHRERGAAGLTLAILALVTAACPGPATAGERNDTANTVWTGADAPQPAIDTAAGTGQELRPTGAPAPAPRSSNAFATSKLLGKKDRKMVDGEIACYVDFVYAGEEPQQTVWGDPCAKVSAGMIGRTRMETLGWWEKLDAFQRGYVEKMPGGQVLYVEGEFSAAIYPKDETGTAIEITVAD